MSMRRWTGIAGILFVILALVSAFVHGDTPSTEDADAMEQFASFWGDSDNHGRALASAVTGAVGLFFFLWFLGGLWGHLRGAQGGTNAALLVVVGGGAVFVALGMLEHLVRNVIGITLNFSDGYRLDEGLALVLDDLATGTFMAATLGAGAMTAATGVVIRQTRALPIWLAWLGFAIAVLSLPMIPPVSFIAALLLAVFVLAVSIVMLTQAEGTGPERQTSTAATAP